MARPLPLSLDTPSFFIQHRSSSSSSSSSSSLVYSFSSISSSSLTSISSTSRLRSCTCVSLRPRSRRLLVSISASKGETELRLSPDKEQQQQQLLEADDEELVRQVKRVLDLLKKNRDMLFNEVKLTIMIEDPREAERKRLLGIDDSNGVTREDLAAALEEVNEGKIPENRAALRLLVEEMINWPNLEVEAPKSKRAKSLYARATDTGVDPREAAKRLNIDWDSAAEFEADDEDSEVVPPAVGYGALYLVTALPLIIGISVVLILFYNSLQ